MGRPIRIDGEYVTNYDYQEIRILDELLTEAKIPHDIEKLYDGWQVSYPRRGDGQIMDAIEHYGSYGESADLLEIMGLTMNGDNVEGYLTAQEVFERIKMYHDGQWGALQNAVILSDREKTVMKALGAKYVSKDYSTEVVNLWDVKPHLGLDGHFQNNTSLHLLATVDDRFFPFVEEGKIVEFKED